MYINNVRDTGPSFMAFPAVTGMTALLVPIALFLFSCLDEYVNLESDQCDSENGKVASGTKRESYSGSQRNLESGGPCRPKIEECKNGEWAEIQNEIIPKQEECNNIDDDCDGLVDSFNRTLEYEGPEGTLGVGICRAETQRCAEGDWEPYFAPITPRAEICNCLDDNCDGNIDEGLAWTKAWPVSNYERYRQVVDLKQINGGYVLAVTNQAGIAYSEGDDLSETDAKILKTDESGNIIWFNLFPEYFRSMSFRSEPAKIIADETGYTVVGRGFDWQSSPLQQVVLAKFTSDGQAVWQKNYTIYEEQEQYYFNIVTSLDGTSDGGYVFSGYVFGANVNDSHGCFIIKTDEAGEENWRFNFGSEFCSPALVGQGSNGEYVALGTSRNSSLADELAWMRKFDQTGIQTFNQSLYSPSGATLQIDVAAKNLLGGYFLASGKVVDERNNAVFSMAKVNENGSITGESSFTRQVSTYGFELNSIYPKLDGGVILGAKDRRFAFSYIYDVTSEGIVQAERSYITYLMSPQNSDRYVVSAFGAGTNGGIMATGMFARAVTDGSLEFGAFLGNLCLRSNQLQP
ncbi:MAG: MopE-related protein [bacterium]